MRPLPAPRRASGADINLDQNRERHTELIGSRGDFADVARIVNADTYSRLAGKRGEPQQLSLANDLVGNQNVIDAALDHHFRF